MRAVRGVALLITLSCICVGVAHAQGPAPSQASQASEKELATVYIYRLDEDIVAFWFLSRTLPVYLGERPKTAVKQGNVKIAGLKNKRYFMIRIPPGKYVFDTRLMWGHLELDVAAGGEYYLRLDRGNDCPSEDPNYWFIPSTCEDRNPSVESVTTERWRAEMSKLKPIKPGDVKDRKLVIIPASAPSNNSSNPTPR